MNKLSLYDPSTAVRDIDEWVSGFFKPFRAPVADLMPSIGRLPGLPTMDVVENETGSTVTLEMPGLDKKDISIVMHDNEVTISATTKKASETKEEDKVVRSERYYGSIYRKFAVNHSIDESKSTAKYDKGILTLMLPKMAGETTLHKLSVM